MQFLTDETESLRPVSGRLFACVNVEFGGFKCLKNSVFEIVSISNDKYSKK